MLRSASIVILDNRHSGFLGFAPIRAIHTGGPSRELTRFIQHSTRTDNDGRRYFRRDGGPWMRLANPSSFQALNSAIDAARPAIAEVDRIYG
jgi:hypothetical protein